MQFKDAFKAIAKSRGYTQSGIADEVGVRLASLATVLRKNNPTVNGVSKYLRVLGYDISLTPVGAKLPEGSYVITKED